MNPSVEPHIQKIAVEAQKIIGELILKAGDIEDLLWVEISRFFLESDNTETKWNKLKQHPDFKSKVKKFDEELEWTLTFSQKISMLKMIMTSYQEKYSLISSSEREKLFSEIEEAKLLRNACAHGQLTIDYNLQYATLRHINKQGERREYPLSREKIIEYKNCLFRPAIQLMDLHPGICIESTKGGQ